MSTEIMKKLKNIIMLFCGKLIRLYFRYTSCIFAKKYLWHTYLKIYVNWRKFNTVATTRQGIKFNLTCPHSDVIQSYIYYFGVWEPNLTDYIIRNLSSGDIFIDVGCNIGYYACLASKIVGKKGRVHAIEAEPGIYEMFLKNLKLNNISNVVAYNKAVYGEEAVLSIYTGDGAEPGQTTVIKDRADIKKFKKGATISANTLDNIVPHSDLYNAKFIKIDVEGAEWHVIKGIENSLDKFSERTVWAIEILQGARGNDVINLFLKNGYQAYLLENDYSVDAYIKNAPSYLKKLTIPIIKNTDVLFKK